MISRLRPRGTRLSALLGVVALVLWPLFLFRHTLSGRLVISGLDLTTYFYPYRVMAARVISQGRLPLWNPDLYGGAPFLANIQTGVFYPANLLFVVIHGPQAITWSILLHLALAGIFFFLFCRLALGLPWAAAVVGALAFSAGGFALTQTDHLNQNNVLAWMPAAVLAVDQAYRRRSRAWAVGLAFVIALQLLAGHPQEQYYTDAVAAIWLVLLAIRDRASGVWAVLRAAAMPLAGLALGFGLAAVQLLPTLELSHYGIRSGGVSYAEANLLSIPLHQLLGNLVPDYVTPLTLEWGAYIGVVPLLLAVTAVLRRWRDPAVVLLAALALLAVLLALGRVTPVFWLAYHLVPGYAAFRVPPRALLVFSFAGAALAAIGTAEIQAQRARGGRAWIPLAIVVVLFLAAFPIAWRLQTHRPLPLIDTFLPAGRWVLLGRWAALLLAATLVALAARRWPVATGAMILLVAGELFLAARPLDALKPLPASIYSPDPLIDQALAADARAYRSVSVAQVAFKSPSVPQAELRRLGYVNDYRYANLASIRAGDWPNFAMQAGRATLDGYDGGLLPLSSYLRFRSLLLPGTDNNPDLPFPYLTSRVPDLRLLGLFGVRDVVTDPGTTPADSPPNVDNISVAPNPQALPHAFLVHQVDPSQGVDQDLASIDQSSFDVAHRAIASGAPCPGGSAAAADSVQIGANSAERLSATVRSDAPGLLVVGTVNYPGWSATVDGRPQPVRLVDGVIQGVCVPAGTHQVELAFSPSHWGLAIALSLLSLLAVVMLGFWPGVRRLAAAAPAISPPGRSPSC